jgi:hypothetical protein
MKALKRVMAAEFSRELSDKVFNGMTRLVSHGLWAGSQPGFGLRRMLVSSDGERKQILMRGERKNLRSDHTILVPGPPEEVDCVRDIFRMYIEEKRGTAYIARVINERGIKNGRASWNYQSIRKLLCHEKYAGTLVWGQYTQKLCSRYVPVSKDKWVIQRDVVEPIVNRETFNAAQEIRMGKALNASDQDLLEKARILLTSHGRVTASRARPKTFRFSSGLTVSLVLCLSERTLRGDARWRIQSVNAQRCGFVTLVCLGNDANTGVSEFVVMPSVAHIPLHVSVTRSQRERTPDISKSQRCTRSLGYWEFGKGYGVSRHAVGNTPGRT